DEGCMGESRIVQQSAEGLQPDASLAYVLVAVELGAACGLGVVAVPHANILEPDSRVQMLQSFLHSGRTHDIVAGNVHVAGVDAGGDWHHIAQQFEQFSDLLKASAERVLSSRGVLDQNC